MAEEVPPLPPGFDAAVASGGPHTQPLPAASASEPPPLPPGFGAGVGETAHELLPPQPTWCVERPDHLRCASCDQALDLASVVTCCCRESLCSVCAEKGSIHCPDCGVASPSLRAPPRVMVAMVKAMPVACNACGTQCTRGDWQHHVNNVCGVECPFNCRTEALTRNTLLAHIGQCVYRRGTLACPGSAFGCAFAAVAATVREHASQCAYALLAPQLRERESLLARNQALQRGLREKEAEIAKLREVMVKLTTRLQQRGAHRWNSLPPGAHDATGKMAGGDGAHGGSATPTATSAYGASSASAPALVLDLGSAVTKFGFSGSENALTIPTLAVNMEGDPSSGYAFGDTALAHEDGRYMVERGMVRDWAAMEAFVEHIVDSKLGARCEEHPILVTQQPRAPSARMGELLFETFSVPSVHFSPSGPLCLYAAGRTSGLIVDSGHGTTQVTPAFEGYALPYAVRHTALSGADVTQRLASLLQHHEALRGGAASSTSRAEWILRQCTLKEELCNVAQGDYRDEVAAAVDGSYTLPDGNVITVSGQERLSAPELLFRPADMTGADAIGLGDLVVESVQACAMDLRSTMLENVVLCGGTTTMHGFVDRFASDVTAKAGAMAPVVAVEAVADRAHAAWLGGSILTSLDVFEQMWISLGDWHEKGEAALLATTTSGHGDSA